MQKKVSSSYNEDHVILTYSSLARVYSKEKPIIHGNFGNWCLECTELRMHKG